MNGIAGTAGCGREIVLVGADTGFARGLGASLAAAGLDTTVRQASVAGIPANWRPALVIVDLDRCNDLNVIDRIAKTTPVLAIASGSTVRLAVEVVRRGALDLVSRPVSDARLAEIVGEALASPADVPCPAGPLDRLVGSSPVMGTVRVAVRRAAASPAPVFIRGESGTGKGLCAETIHLLGPRASGPLVRVDCSEIPPELLESEIFGHEADAFAGAGDARDGAAQRADGGTLFLDEICEMDPDLQARLLRFVQTGMVRRVGGDAVRKVDARIVCATSRDPRQAVKSGRLRADLFYRLHVLPVALPPLRVRGNDALEIAEAILPRLAAEEGRRCRRLDGDAGRLIVSHDWPGNVRELVDVLRCAVSMNDGEVVCGTMLALALAFGDDGGFGSSAGLAVARSAEPVDIRPLKLQERDIIEAAVASCNGNVAKAAAKLGLTASAVHRKRQSWIAGTA